MDVNTNVNTNVNNSDVCFICFDESGELLQANICCGTTYYHSKCFDKYCNKTEKKCPICRNSINDKIQLVQNKKKIDWKFCIKFSLKAFVITAYVALVVSGFVMFHILREKSNGKVYGSFVFGIVIGLFTWMIPMLGHGKTDRNMTNPWNSNRSTFFTTLMILSIICAGINPIVLLITSTIDIYHPNTIGYVNIMYIYSVINFGIPCVSIVCVIIMWIYFSIRKCGKCICFVKREGCSNCINNTYNSCENCYKCNSCCNGYYDSCCKNDSSYKVKDQYMVNRCNDNV